MTEKQLLEQLEKELEAKYEDLDEQAREEIDAFAVKFEKASKKKEDKLSKEEYEKWKKKYILYSASSLLLVKALSKRSTNMNVKSAKIISDYMPKAYKIGFDDWAKGFNVNFALNIKIPDLKALEFILKSDRLLPKPSIDIPKDLKWNERKIKSALVQSTLKGESIPKLAKRLEKTVGMNKTSAIRNARTMMTASHNYGKLKAGLEAKKLGINVKKEWIATHDGRTRDSHIDIDGEVVEMDKTFSNGLMFPADPLGDPAEVYNCRCSMGEVIGDPL